MRKLYQSDQQKWLNLLEKEGIRPEAILDEKFGIFNDDNELIATGARYHNILKCLAVDEKAQGGAIFNELMTHLINRVVANGFQNIYVYTKESAKKSFEYLGFKELERVDDKLYFMERGFNGFDMYLADLKTKKVEKEKVAAIVMNANPFTKGHQYLVTQAALENDVVHLFVLSEELSAFNAKVRFRLVKEGTAHLDNVIVHETKSYMVSAATFPSYFLKEDDDVTEIQARLDARLFKNHIAPALGITRRYVGNEPLSHATNIYNRALQTEFAPDLELVVLERIKADEDIISATRVRKLLSEGKLEEVEKYVPKTTYDFLCSQEGRAIIENLKK